MVDILTALWFLESRARRITVGLFLVIFLATFLAMTGCRPDQQAPVRNFTLHELLPPESIIPNEWALLRVDDEMDNTSENEANWVIFYAKDESELTRGVVTVSQHETVAAAARSFKKDEWANFDHQGPWDSTPVFIPDGFSFSSPSATQQRIGCQGWTTNGLFDDTIKCRYLAQYEEFIVYFRINIMYQGEMTISLDETEQLLSDIDAHLEKQLAASTQN